MQEKPDALVLYVARNAALCYFAVRWLARRLPNMLQRLMLLKRLFVLYEPFYEGPRAVTVREGRIEMTADASMRRASLSRPSTATRSSTSDAAVGEPSKNFALVVVDESHHIYSDKQLRGQVEAYVQGETRRMLISDVSQSLGWGEPCTA